MSRAQENIKVEPVEVKFSQVQTDCVLIPAQGTETFDGTYWTFSSSTTNYYVWYNLDAGSVDPAVAGATGIEVAVVTGETGPQIATKVVAAIDAVSDLASIIDPRNSSRVIVKVLEYAAGTPSAAGTVTEHQFVSVHLGFSHDFGFTDGDLELTVDQQLLDVTAHQSGTEILTALITGLNAELTVALKEISDENLEVLIEQTAGGAFTPGSGTKLQGFGSGQNFTNVLDKSGRLILHPARLPDNDTSEDYVCWLAYPKLDSIAFSGENPQLINVTFRVFRDEFIDDAVNKVAIGDHTQL